VLNNENLSFTQEEPKMSAAAAKEKETVEVPTAEEAFNERLCKARKIVRKNMYWSMGIGVVPMPIVDLLGVAGFQAKALKELSDLYGIPFFNHTIKNILAMLISGSGTVYMGYPLTQVFAQAIGGSALKSIPVIGQVVSIATVPVIAGALTYATGQVFIQHFESGGTFLSFNPKKVRAYFQEQFAEGMKIASEAASS